MLPNARPNIFNFNEAKSGGLYVIPTTINTVISVNANDLAHETARIGPAWTQNGSVPYTDGGVSGLSNVGPFPTMDCFSVTVPAGVTDVFTATLIVKALSLTNLPVLVGFGVYLQWYNSPVILLVSSGAALEFGLAPGNQTVITFGCDGTNVYLTVNGIYAGTGAGLINLSTQALNLGNLTSGQPYNLDGNIYEFSVSTDVPSQASFTAIYNAISSAGG